MIKDKATGEIFRSYPEPIYETTLAEGETSDLAAYDLSTETGQFITSPVFVGYTKSGMDGGFVLGVNQMKHVKTVYFIENGIRLRYEMKELELEFSVEITIEGRDLVYRIPVNGIIEREGLENEQQDRRPLLTSLSVLPYLGAHRSGQEGYFVTPDGTGALTRFDVARVSNYNEYSKRYMDRILLSMRQIRRIITICFLRSVRMVSLKIERKMLPTSIEFQILC